MSSINIISVLHLMKLCVRRWAADTRATVAAAPRHVAVVLPSCTSKYVRNPTAAARPRPAAAAPRSRAAAALPNPSAWRCVRNRVAVIRAVLSPAPAAATPAAVALSISPSVWKWAPTRAAVAVKPLTYFHWIVLLIFLCVNILLLNFKMYCQWVYRKCNGYIILFLYYRYRNEMHIGTHCIHLDYINE